ncbi:MAG: hypothetical protein M3O35_20785 [Acidobacteriota bacterium]|nr:hypothetical protein [Acidobacteriota bacterium]
MQLPLAYLDAAVIEEVPIELWRDVFDATGWPQSLAGKRESFSHDEVLLALQQDASDNQLQAIETLHTLGTEGGREAIVAAMNDRRVPADALPVNAGEREFALRLYLAQRGDASMADVFARAQIQVQEGGEQRRYNEFMGKEARRVKNLSRAREKLREEVLRHCRQSDLGEHVDIRAFEDDGAIVFNILRSDRTRKPLAVVHGRDARATIEFRPVHGDLLRYESSVGRLRIAARAASIVEFYRTALGKILFNDEFFFDGEPVYNLRVLQERGRTAFQDHGVFRVGRIWMTECLWERGDRNLLHIRSSDCFRSIEELRLPLAEGDILQAKLKLEVVGKSTRPVTVSIRVPSRIDVSQRIHEPLVESVLQSVGIRRAAPSLSGSNLWSLHPWRHPIAEWRTLFGSSLDALVRAGVLTTIQLDSVRHPEHPEAGRILRVNAISETESYGVSDALEIASRSLSATDLDGLELKPEQFRLWLRSALDITNGGCPWDGQDVLHLGFVEVGEQRLYAAYALRPPGPGIGERIRGQADGAPSFVLFPPSGSDASELSKVLLDSVLPKRNQVVREAIKACGLANSMAAIDCAPDGARLVVDTRLQKVWVDGLEINNLPAESHPFRFIELMARSCGPMSLNEISAKLSSGRQDGNTTARQAKGNAKRIISEALLADGRELDGDPFPSAGGGFYRCALPSHVGPSSSRDATFHGASGENGAAG